MSNLLVNYSFDEREHIGQVFLLQSYNLAIVVTGFLMRKGYNKTKTNVGKLLARRIQTFRLYFCVIIFWPLIFQNKWKYVPNANIPGRFGFALSNTCLPRSEILLRSLFLLANWFLVKEVQLICARLIICIDLVRTSDSLVRNIVFLIFSK